MMAVGLVLLSVLASAATAIALMLRHELKQMARDAKESIASTAAIKKEMESKAKAIAAASEAYEKKIEGMTNEELLAEGNRVLNSAE